MNYLLLLVVHWDFSECVCACVCRRVTPPSLKQWSRAACARVCVCAAIGGRRESSFCRIRRVCSDGAPRAGRCSFHFMDAGMFDFYSTRSSRVCIPVFPRSAVLLNALFQPAGCVSASQPPPNWNINLWGEGGLSGTL